MDNGGFTFTGLELFFIVTTILSLIVNLLQWRDRRAFQGPLTNALVALFNDIKAKSNNLGFVYGALFNPGSPHSTIETLRWEYGLFTQTIFAYFQGFQEATVGLLVTLNPHDKEGRGAFRASDYGLSEQEKRWRDETLRRFQEQFATPATLPSGGSQPPAGSEAAVSPPSGVSPPPAAAEAAVPPPSRVSRSPIASEATMPPPPSSAEP